MLTKENIQEICRNIERQDLEERERLKPVPPSVNKAVLDRAITLLKEIAEIKRSDQAD